MDEKNMTSRLLIATQILQKGTSTKSLEKEFESLRRVKTSLFLLVVTLESCGKKARLFYVKHDCPVKTRVFSCKEKLSRKVYMKAPTQITRKTSNSDPITRKLPQLKSCLTI